MSLKRGNNFETSKVSKLTKCKTFEGLNDLMQYVEMKTNDERKVSVLNYLRVFFCISL